MTTFRLTWVGSALVVLALALISGCGNSEQPEKPSEPAAIQQSNSAQLRGKINEGIQHAKAKDVDWIFDQMFNPAETKVLRTAGEYDKDKAQFKEHDTLALLQKCLEAVTDDSLALEETATHCSVPLAEALGGPDALNFEKVDGTWYLNNK